MTIDLVDNQEHFEEVYPSDSDGSVSSDDDDSESDHEPQAIKDITAQLRKLKWSVAEEMEDRNAAQARLNMLDSYAQGLAALCSDDINIEACVEAYQTQRAKAFGTHKKGAMKLEEYEEEIKKLHLKRGKLLQKENAQKRKDDKQKSKDKKMQEREKQRKIKEKNRLKQERSQFWPKKVYKVVLCLDANSGLTPASSRRGSFDSIQKIPMASPGNRQSISDGKSTDMSKIDLSFSYITHSASWVPRYDLAIETVSKSGSITYRAEFRNKTSETWRNAKVILSTSQTSFQGLGEPIPRIQPWRIRLSKAFGDKVTDDALYSRHEPDGRFKNGGLFGQKPQAPRNQLFGSTFGGKDVSSILSGAPVPAPPAGSNLFGNSGNSAFGSNSGGGCLFSAANSFSNADPIFGRAHDLPIPVESVQSRSRGLQSTAPQAFGAVQAETNIIPIRQQPLADEDEADLDTETIAPDAAALAFEESTWEEAGLTATYTVPGSKTIAPSNTTRRHKIASIPLNSITLSHIIVPKLRVAAFLKARLRNTSPSTLLSGPVGLTLDGTFLGNTTLPRSSPGEAFVLNLGVDPALNVVYSKPLVRRSQSGVFQKDGSRIYTRSCTLTNTKNNTVVEATVLDQIPVSEDDKLKVEVLTPQGLRKEGDVAVKAGVGQVNEGTGKKGSTYAEGSGGERAEKGKWGKATAKMKKEGEIEWDVKLNLGQGVKLELEYEARFPGGEGIVGV